MEEILTPPTQNGARPDMASRLVNTSIGDVKEVIRL
jgi:hypothetical protein